jgi:localization factor PodJL
MAASLDDVRKEIERSTPISALLSIERRLEEIAARLDQEIARPERAVIDSHRFSDLTDRIESMRRSLEERTRPDAETRELNASMEKLNAKLEAAEHNGAGARAVEPLLTQMSAKLDAIAAPALQWPAIQDVVEQIARRIENRSASGIDGEVLAEQIAHIHDRLDTIDRQSGKSYNVESVAQELLDRLRKAGLAPSPGEPNAPDEVRAKLAVDLAELRAEQANASRRTHSRLTVLQDILEQLVERIASIEAEVSNDTEHDWRPSAYGETARGLLATALPGIEALGGEDFSDVAPRGRPAESSAGSPEAGPTSADDDEARQASQHGEEILLEPGARAPQLAQTARDRAGSSDSATNSAIRAHIAAARRAAQAAVAEDDGKALNIPRGAPQIRLVTRSVERAKGFYANNKRSVLLGVAVLIVATVAIRLIGAHPPLLQKSDLEKQATKAASVGAPSGEPVDAGRASIPSWSIDPTPTASLGPASETGKAAAPSALESRAQVPPELLTTIPDGLSPALRDAVVAGEPGAQYELAQRLTEGRGVPQDRQAAALWFERAALLGLAPAQFSIAAMYEKGVGVVRDPAAAKRWYLKAAEAGNARAAHNLAVMDAESVNERPDYPEAARWFRKAGELGVRDSQYNLAILYARGLGVEQDLRQSWLWFSLAAGQGDADAAKKRDEVAAKMDPSSLAAAADSLAKFKVARQDPAANEVATPPGGWDARSAPPSARQTPRPPGGETRPQAPL